MAQLDKICEEHDALLHGITNWIDGAIGGKTERKGTASSTATTSSSASSSGLTALQSDTFGQWKHTQSDVSSKMKDILNDLKR